MNRSQPPLSLSPSSKLTPPPSSPFPHLQSERQPPLSPSSKRTTPPPSPIFKANDANDAFPFPDLQSLPFPRSSKISNFGLSTPQVICNMVGVDVDSLMTNSTDERTFADSANIEKIDGVNSNDNDNYNVAEPWIGMEFPTYVDATIFLGVLSATMRFLPRLATSSSMPPFFSASCHHFSRRVVGDDASIFSSYQPRSSLLVFHLKMKI